MIDGGATRPTVAVIGGGLAGLAAAAALTDLGARVDLYEARRKLGGRAASFRDAATDELVDHCQHVGMACCTNLVDFCRRTGIADQFRRDRVLHFFGPDGRRFDVAAAPCLPAPLHLLPSVLRLGYLSWRERLGVCRAMLCLARSAATDDSQAIGPWLARHGQTPRAIEMFWAPVIVSALGETVERASLKYARKVFVDGFLMNRDAYAVDVPTVSLGALYGERLERYFVDRGVTLQRDRAARAIRRTGDGRCCVEFADGTSATPDAVVVAVTWRRAAELLDAELRTQIPGAERWATFAAAPISGVHLWFDRELTDLPHAVLVGTLAQWVFARTRNAELGTRNEAYYQVVISASYDVAGMDKSTVVARVVDELRVVFPAAQGAALVRSKIVTEQEAVFSVQPGLDAFRPAQTTPVPGLFLAGDWTATGWPATMEGAVRSGYLAAEGVAEYLGRPQPFVVTDLPPGRLARALFDPR